MSAEPAGAGPADLLERLRRRGQTVAVAESLTAGLVSARLADVAGASEVLRGGVVAYSTDLKATLAGVDPALLARRGPVHPEVAAAMADGVRRRLAADWGLATTGVAGPTGQDGVAVGTVHVAVAGPAGVGVRSLALTGDRARVRALAGDAVLALLAERLGVEADR